MQVDFSIWAKHGNTCVTHLSAHQSVNTHSVDTREPQLYLSSSKGLINKVAIMVGMVVIYEVSNMNLIHQGLTGYVHH